MYKKLLFLTFTALTMACNTDVKKEEATSLAYPETAKVDTVDTYFGTEVPDPYRWLENDRSPETEAWVKAQNEVTFGYLAQIPFRDKLRQRMEQLWNYPKYSAPWRDGNKYFFFKNDGVQNQEVLYMQDSLKGEASVLIDPNTLSADGTAALTDYAVSADGKYLAYGVATAGSDWVEYYVLDIATRQVLDDHLEWGKFSSASWYNDGFYYSRYDKPAEGGELSGKNEYHKVYYHKVGTAQSADELIYKNDEYPLRNYAAYTSDDERFLFLSESEGTDGNALYMKRTGTADKFVKIADGFKSDYFVVDNVGDKILIRTNNNAPRYKIVAIDANKPLLQTDLVPQQTDVLNGAQIINNKIVTIYMQDAKEVASVYDLNGKKIKDIDLPGIGSFGGLNVDKENDCLMYAFTSFTFPSTIFKYDMATAQTEVLHKSEIDFDIDSYETKQIFYPSKDGTKIPMFLVYKKGLKLDGNNPTLLYGYGGFNISLTPAFSISNTVLLENGFVYALANLRGGGEYGEDWHQAGTKLKKQNVFDDFVAAAEYLQTEKYTSPDKLAIMGGSNGGLLVGAVMTQRPDLCKVAFPMVGVLDMLRFHKFTIGWAWTGDYGSSDNEEEFRYLLGYSPLHNLKAGVEYPATMVTTGDHDDRVVPAHSFKFAATLQEKYSGTRPMLIRIETNAGHGAGKPTSKVIDERADLWAFMMYNMGITPR